MAADEDEVLAAEVNILAARDEILADEVLIAEDSILAVEDEVLIAEDEVLAAEADVLAARDELPLEVSDDITSLGLSEYEKVDAVELPLEKLCNEAELADEPGDRVLLDKPA